MTRKFSIIFFNIVLTTSILLAQQKKTDTLYFDHNKYDLSETAKIKLNLLYQNNKVKEILGIDLVGYTDSDGSDKYNLTLSQKRTKAVSDFFISKGIKADLIKIKCYGESKSVNSNEKDRRVEILIETNEILDSRKQQVTEKQELVVGDIFEKLKKEPQKFKCLGNKDIMIKGKEGTVVVIPANSLIKKNGEIVTGEIDFSLEEFYKKSEIISSNLNTMSNNEILETGGMINITASYKGQQIMIDNDKKIIIRMATKNNYNGMQTFVSENSGEEMNWILPTPSHSDSVNLNKAKKKKRRRIIMSKRLVLGFGKRNNSTFNSYQGIKDTAIKSQLYNTDKLIIKSNKLGWINCDRFPDIKNKTNIIVKVDTAYWPVVRLIFKDINSIMPGYYNSNKDVKFINIPVGYKLTLIAFSLVNNEPYYASKQIVITKDLIIKLDLTKTTLTKLEEDLKKLD